MSERFQFTRDLGEEFARLERGAKPAEGWARRASPLLPWVAASVAAALVALVLLNGIPGGGGEAEGQAIDPETRAILGVFRRDRVPADRQPGNPFAELRASGDGQPGEDPSQSRRVDLPTGTVYLWPMDNGVCVTWGNCVETRVIREAGVAISTELHGTRDKISEAAVSGIVRDGIDEVVVRLADGRQITVPVEENVFRFEAADGDVPTEVRWADGDEMHGQRIPTPENFGPTR